MVSFMPEGIWSRMTAQWTERLSAGQEDTSGPGRHVCLPERASHSSRQRGAGSARPIGAYFLAALILMICAVWHWTPVYGSTLQLHMQDNLLSLSAADADLSAILQRLGEAAGIDFKFPKDVERKITLQFSDVRLETALKRILKGLNYATVYSSAGSGDSPRISAVYIYGIKKGGDRTGQSIVPEKPAQHSISDYEKRVKVVQKLLDRVGRDSQAGRRYQKEIENYQRLIERLKRQK